MEFENEKSFKQLISQDGINLFLGAGFSVHAKNRHDDILPPAGQLQKILVEHFELKEYASQPFYRVNAHLKRNRKSEFQHLLRDLFTVRGYIDEYNIINKLPIINIFTTNIDDLIERIYESPDSLKTYSDVEVTGFMENPEVNLFKLHGSVRHTHDKDFLFTSEELATSFAKDPSLWNAVATKIASRVTLFWGTSLQDTNILETLASSTINDRPQKPRWIVVRPGKEHDLDAEDFKNMGFRIIRASTEEMLKYFQENVLNVQNNIEDIEDGDGNLEYHTLFPNNYINQIIYNKNKQIAIPLTSFYQGQDPTWSIILSDQLIKISFYDEAIDRIQLGGALHLSGSPGCGKSTLLMQLAASDEIQGDKFFFADITTNKAKLFASKIAGKKQVFVFIDNMADNVDAYNMLFDLPNVTIISCERDLRFEQIKHRVKIRSNQIMEIGSLPDTDIHRICSSMNKPVQRFDSEKVSLFEIVYRVWAGSKLDTKIQQLIKEISKESNQLLELYTLMTYIRYTRTFASMDMLYSYFSGGESFDPQKVYSDINKLSSLIDNTNYNNDETQDYYSLRSTAFSELSLKHIPKNVLGYVVNKFHDNVHRGAIHRFDIFRKRAYDADLTILAFPEEKDGIKFYHTLLGKDDSHFIRHQFALYLWRKGNEPLAWDQIDRAYTDSNGSVHSISNSHAMILFDTNIKLKDDGSGIIKETLLRSFEVLEKCLRYDDRSTYHVIRYTEQAIEYYNKYISDSESENYINNAAKYINSEKEKSKDHYIPKKYYNRLIRLERIINSIKNKMNRTHKVIS